eukprot:EC723983.1.p1 GENE.EC723983.1~~EC723983.1.p1  ORF type:complete len:82 (+),score=16.17 EC723983.1:72-317(+)
MNKLMDRIIFGPGKYVSETGVTVGAAMRYAKEWTADLARYGVVAAGLALVVTAPDGFTENIPDFEAYDRKKERLAQPAAEE